MSSFSEQILSEFFWLFCIIMSFLVADKVHCNIYQAQWNFIKYSFHPGTFRVERVALKNRQNFDKYEMFLY